MGEATVAAVSFFGGFCESFLLVKNTLRLAFFFNFEGGCIFSSPPFPMVDSADLHYEGLSLKGVHLLVNRSDGVFVYLATAGANQPSEGRPAAERKTNSDGHPEKKNPKHFFAEMVCP